MQTSLIRARTGCSAGVEAFSSSRSGSGGEADEPAAKRGLQRGRGPPHLLRHLRGGCSPASVQDAHHPQRPEGEGRYISYILTVYHSLRSFSLFD